MRALQDPRELLIGEMAVLLRVLSQDQLNECVGVQVEEGHRRPLGEIMIEKGFARREALTALLSAQKQEIEEFERESEYGQLFGKNAIARGFITEDQLTEAVRAQARMHARSIRAKLGQVMLDLGYLTMKQFWTILSDQGDFFCGTCQERIVKPAFQGRTVLCPGCRTAAFSVTIRQAGPKPRKRKAVRRRTKGGAR